MLATSLVLVLVTQAIAFIPCSDISADYDHNTNHRLWRISDTKLNVSQVESNFSVAVNFKVNNLYDPDLSFPCYGNGSLDRITYRNIRGICDYPDNGTLGPSTVTFEFDFSDNKEDNHLIAIWQDFRCWSNDTRYVRP